VNVVELPRGLLYARDVALKRFLAEADAAKAEIAHEAAWAAALEATTNDPRFELRGAVRLHYHRFLSHFFAPVKEESRGCVCTGALRHLVMNTSLRDLGSLGCPKLISGIAKKQGPLRGLENIRDA